MTKIELHIYVFLSILIIIFKMLWKNNNRIDGPSTESQASFVRILKLCPMESRNDIQIETSAFWRMSKKLFSINHDVMQYFIKCHWKRHITIIDFKFVFTVTYSKTVFMGVFWESRPNYRQFFPRSNPVYSLFFVKTFFEPFWKWKIYYTISFLAL